jgi:hypothetical protein
MRLPTSSSLSRHAHAHILAMGLLSTAGLSLVPGARAQALCAAASVSSQATTALSDAHKLRHSPHLTGAPCSTEQTFTTVAAMNRLPRLGRAWRKLPGFGQVRPPMVSFGGDPTSEAYSIHWQHWGAPEAVGVGLSDWVWPGTCVGCNRPSSVRVVAFDLGTCRGQASYNAFEWYFPQYDETFKPGDYTNPCTHRSITSEPRPPLLHCPDAELAGEGTATEMSVEGMSCEAAAVLVAQLPAGPFATEQRFEQSGFRCGTQGASIGSDVVSCTQGEQSVFYTAVY